MVYNFVIFFSLQKLKKMAEPRLLKLQSPAYGEPIFYKWPLINTVKYLLKFHNFILLILSILAGAKENRLSFNRFKRSNKISIFNYICSTFDSHI